MVDSDKQTKYNSDSSGSNTFNYYSGNKQDHTKVETSFKTRLANANENWDSLYPKDENVELRNRPEIETANPNLESINTQIDNSNSFPIETESTLSLKLSEETKSSKYLARPNLDNINGHLNNPSSKIDVLSHIKDLKNKLK